MTSPHTKQHIRNVLKFCQKEFSFEMGDLRKRSRQSEYLNPRSFAFLLLFEFYHLSYSHIGRVFGYTHSCVMQSVHRVKQEDWTTPLYQKFIHMFSTREILH